MHDKREKKNKKTEIILNPVIITDKYSQTHKVTVIRIDSEVFITHPDI